MSRLIAVFNSLVLRGSGGEAATAPSIDQLIDETTLDGLVDETTLDQLIEE